MLTKFILHLPDEDCELQPDDLRNWDEILCTYKRSSYDGVVRSFSSSFEFVNTARQLLLDVYLADRFTAEASIEVQTITDRWEYETRFEAPLDFSTIEWDAYSLTLNSVDNSLSALIKSNKSTTYEFEVDTDITSDETLFYDRLRMEETVTYEFTQGEQFDDCADIVVTVENGVNPWIGNVGDEMTVNGVIDWLDDQEDSEDSYLLKAVADATVTLDFEVSYRTDMENVGANIGVRVRRDGEVVSDAVSTTEYLAHPGGGEYSYLGEYASSDDLLADYPSPTETGQWALVGEIVWKVEYNGIYYWSNTYQTQADYFTKSESGTRTLTLLKGDEVYIYADYITSYQTDCSFRIVTSSFVFSWTSRGNSVDFPVFKPVTVAKTLLNRIAQDADYSVSVEISDTDSRLASTWIAAAESIRDIPGAKLYSSFNDFCDWMSAVFGYVYLIGEQTSSSYTKEVHFGRNICTTITPSGTYTGTVDVANIYYNLTKFFYYDKTDDGTNFYEYWDGWEDYNDPDTGLPHTDTVYIEDNTGKAWGFDESGNRIALGNEGDDFTLDTVTVTFLHRSELFGESDSPRVIGYSRDLKYTVDSSAIYSSVTIGYEEQDYDSVNGRDEFNFSNTYTTGCSVSDSELSLLSKYRADCYGIEFAVLKRDEDTTDTDSDKDVFFVNADKSGTSLVVTRTLVVENALSDTVFNAAYSPMACVQANAGYIGLQASAMTLTFASSTGNSSIVIDGQAMSDDITLGEGYATNGQVEFTTDEVDDIANVDELIEVEDSGITYRGYLLEVDVKYAATEAANYKLIVKEIET